MCNSVLYYVQSSNRSLQNMKKRLNNHRTKIIIIYGVDQTRTKRKPLRLILRHPRQRSFSLSGSPTPFWSSKSTSYAARAKTVPSLSARTCKSRLALCPWKNSLLGTIFISASIKVRLWWSGFDQSQRKEES